MDFRDEIDAFIEKNELSRNRFAETIGVNPAYLSKYMKEGDSYKYSERVAAPAKTYIENYIQKNRETKGDMKGKKLPFVQTRDTRSIEMIMRWAIADDEMSIIVGSAGTGKSRTVEEWTKRHPNAHLIETTMGLGANELFEQIADVLGVRPPRKKSLNHLIQICADALKKKESQYFIIDEAERLNYRALEALRRMYDFSDKPLILVGTKQLLDNLTGRGKRDQNEYEQLRSRISGKWMLQGLVYVKEHEGGVSEVDDDLKAVCKLFGIHDDETVNSVKRLTKGNFRDTRNLLRKCNLLLGDSGIGISKEVVEEAVKMMIVHQQGA